MIRNDKINAWKDKKNEEFQMFKEYIHKSLIEILPNQFPLFNRISSNYYESLIYMLK
jgi:hypothetical protein